MIHVRFDGDFDLYGDARSMDETGIDFFPRQRNTHWVGLLCIAAILYIAFMPLYYVGLFNDDATYLLEAKSILSGHFVLLGSSGRTSLPVYPPGLPLFLAPFVWLIGPHWEFLKCLPVALTLVSGVMLWSLGGSWLEPEPRLAALGLFALNPTLAAYSCTLMSEPLFIATALAVFLLLRNALSRQTTWEPWLLGCLLAYAALIRLTGFALVGAVLAALLYARRPRDAGKAAAVSLGLLGIFLLRNYSVSHHLTRYSHAWQLTLGEFRRPSDYFDNVMRVTQMTFADNLLPNPATYGEFGLALRSVLAILVLLVIGVEIRTWSRQPLSTRALSLATMLFVLAWYAVHTLWTSVNGRYALPLLPFLAIFFAAGSHRIFRSLGSGGRIVRIGAVLALVSLYSYRNATVFAFTANRTLHPEWRMPRLTWEWVNSHLPPQALFLNPKAAEINLYTGRFALGLLYASDQEDFRAGVLAGGVTHILMRPNVMYPSGRNADRAWRLDQEWTAAWPEAFKKVYDNPREGTAIYEVVPDTAFVRAFQWYQAARQDLARSAAREGLNKLEQALSVYPRLASALNAYGAACLLSGRDLKKAEAHLREAVRIRPRWPLVLINLARLYRETGRPVLARACLIQAGKIIRESGESEPLWSAIGSELRALGNSAG